MGHARCDRAVRLLHQASSSDRAGAGSHGWTSPVQDTHAGQSFSGSHPPPPVPARDHHRTTGSLTVILGESRAEYESQVTDFRQTTTISHLQMAAPFAIEQFYAFCDAVIEQFTRYRASR
jgi:hypothetical protein